MNETITPEQARDALVEQAQELGLYNTPERSATWHMGSARNARINQAIKHGDALLAILKRWQGQPKGEHLDDKDGWFEARSELESLVQSVHEANAYNNASQKR